MFRLWAKEFKNHKIVRDIVIENDDSTLNRTRKIFNAIEEVCRVFDLSAPIWLDSSVNEFKKLSKVRFSQDNFIDSIDFDYLEIHVIEED